MMILCVFIDPIMCSIINNEKKKFPLVMETYGCWGDEAIKCLDRLAARIATHTDRPKSSAVLVLYRRLSIVLFRANARAILARSSVY